jgi:hypothetical protein
MDRRVQVRIGEEAKKETTAMKAIAVVTIWSATFFSVTLTIIFKVNFQYFPFPLQAL